MRNANNFQELTVSKKEMEEDILEEIWHMQEAGESVTIAEVARRFSMDKKSMAFYIKKMAEHGYIERMKNSTCLCLTGLGRTIGSGCSYRHDALMVFLQSVGAEPEEAEEKACRMEHLIGSDLVRNICELMQDGTRIEKKVKVPDLNNLYAYGDHPCMIGVYRDTDQYPKKLLLEYAGIQNRGVLKLQQKESYFYLPLKEKLSPVKLWYLESGGGWQAAKETEDGLQLPVKAFLFTASTFDYVAVGRTAVSFGKTYEAMEKKNKLELLIRVLE